MEMAPIKQREEVSTITVSQKHIPCVSGIWKIKVKYQYYAYNIYTMCIRDLDKLGYSGLVFGLCQVLLLSQLPQKTIYFTSGQN